MRDSTLSIILLFILGLVSTCFYWSFYIFIDPERPCVHDALVQKRKSTFTALELFDAPREGGGLSLSPDSGAAPDSGAGAWPALEEQRDDDKTPPPPTSGGGGKRPKVRGVVFPPPRVPIEVEVNESVWERSVEEFKKHKAQLDFSRLHFGHVPKAGGTSMTILLRQLMCEQDPEANKDCCTPGICYFKRPCNVIAGCYGHLPNRPLLLAAFPSVTMIRNPIERLVSGFLYYGHNPNADSFKVRPYFRDIKHGNLPKMEFADFIELPEYQNVLTRMLGADAFPYSNVTVDKAVYGRAVQAMERFFVVGVMEEFNISVELTFKRLRAARIPTSDEIPREREAVRNRRQRKEIILSNSNLIQRAAVNNLYDIQLYRFGVARFCKVARFFPEVFAKVEASGRLDCSREGVKRFSRNIVLDKYYA
jgi:hypothetical protein